VAIKKQKRLPKYILDGDREALEALKTVAGYAPANPSLSVESLVALDDRLRQSQTSELLTTKTLAAQRDATDDVGWEFHNAMQDAKTSVKGQFGPNSNEVQALGLKKKSDYKRPTRRAAAKKQA
jgi:hypothetical protein